MLLTLIFGQYTSYKLWLKINIIKTNLLPKHLTAFHFSNGSNHMSNNNIVETKIYQHAWSILFPVVFITYLVTFDV